MDDRQRLAGALAPQAELRAYQPTLRDRIASFFVGDERPSPEKARLVEGIFGSRGLGNTGMGLVDLTPAGAPLWTQEYKRAQTPTEALAAALNFIPGAKGAAHGVKGVADDIAEAVWYHGTRKTGKAIENFDPRNIRGLSRRNEDDISSFFTTDRNLANSYAGQEGAVYPVHASVDDLPVVTPANAEEAVEILRRGTKYADPNRLSTFPAEWGVEDYIAGGFGDMNEQQFRDQFAAALDGAFDGEYIIIGPNGDRLLAITDPGRVKSFFSQDPDL